MRNIRQIYAASAGHWVGDGFKVSQLFSHMGEDRQTNPFLMFDYAAPMEFAPRQGRPRGVGAHPHRGFETVTIAYSGEVAHRDSSGGGGVIRQGDVQWMTAGRGVVHEEFHSESFSRSGGRFEMAQLWINLPAKDKNTPPRYQHLAAGNIPTVAVGGSGSIRVIAGQFGNVAGAAQTFTPINVWDVSIYAGQELRLNLPENHNLSITVRHGEVEINGGKRAGEAQLAVFEREAGEIVLRNSGSRTAEILLLSGEPIDEPVVGYGPFVMNSVEEIRESIEEFNSGKYGSLD